MAIEVAVSGSGKMGREVAAAVAGAPDMEFRGFIDALAPYDEVMTRPGVPSPGECFEAQSCDVVVDSTNATFTPKLVEAALAAGVRPVIGTSGLPSEWVEQLRQTCAKQNTGAAGSQLRHRRGTHDAVRETGRPVLRQRGDYRATPRSEG
ncbi:MAG: hypothetical protein R3C29_03220 [Dehalococcoidia bacterium]